MTDENRRENLELKNECFCKSIWFKEFLIKTIAVFVGVYCALSLFTALHKPPMLPCPFAKHPMMRPAVHCHHHFHGQKRFNGDYKYRKDLNNKISPDKIKLEIKE